MKNAILIRPRGNCELFYMEQICQAGKVIHGDTMKWFGMNKVGKEEGRGPKEDRKEIDEDRVWYKRA